jgi:hypothetical protein
MTNGKILRLTLARLRSTGALLVSATFAWLGCDSATGPSDDQRLIQTESSAYQLQRKGIALTTEIPHTFTNRTGRTVYLSNCNGAFSILLEREDEDRWKTAWAPWRQTCLSPPIVIEANTVFHDTLQFGEHRPIAPTYLRISIKPSRAVFIELCGVPASGLTRC